MLSELKLLNTLPLPLKLLFQENIFLLSKLMFQMLSSAISVKCFQHLDRGIVKLR